jgi:hypothetical protein
MGDHCWVIRVPTHVWKIHPGSTCDKRSDEAIARTISKCSNTSVLLGRLLCPTSYRKCFPGEFSKRGMGLGSFGGVHGGSTHMSSPPHVRRSQAAAAPRSLTASAGATAPCNEACIACASCPLPVPTCGLLWDVDVQSRGPLNICFGFGIGAQSSQLCRARGLGRMGTRPRPVGMTRRLIDSLVASRRHAGMGGDSESCRGPLLNMCVCVQLQPWLEIKLENSKTPS